MKETLFSIGWNSQLINVFLVSALIESLSFSPQGRPILGFFTGKTNKLQSSDGWIFRGLLAVQTTLTRLHRLEACPGPAAPRLPAHLISLQPTGSVGLETVHCFTAAARLPPPNPLISSPPSDRGSYPLTAKTSFLPGRQRSAVFTLARRGAARSAALLSGLGKHSWWARQPLSILFFFKSHIPAKIMMAWLKKKPKITKLVQPGC